MLLMLKVKKIWGESYIVIESMNEGLVFLLKRIFKVKIQHKRNRKNIITFYVKRGSDLEKKVMNKAWRSAFRDKMTEVVKDKRKFLLQPAKRREKWHSLIKPQEKKPQKL